MRRLLGHIPLALSLLLCAAVAGMGVRSYWSADYLYYTIPEEGRAFGTVTKEAVSYGVLQRKGVLQLEWLTNTSVPAHYRNLSVQGRVSRWREGFVGRWAWGAVDLSGNQGKRWLRIAAVIPSRGSIGWREPTSSFLQFGYARLLYDDGDYHAGPTPGVCRLLTVPHWAIGLPGLVVPLLMLSRAWRRRRREAKGLCPACGYDLRATPARCPECGRKTASPAPAA